MKTKQKQAVCDSNIWWSLVLKYLKTPGHYHWIVFAFMQDLIWLISYNLKSNNRKGQKKSSTGYNQTIQMSEAAVN